MIVDIVDKYLTDDNNPIKKTRFDSIKGYSYRAVLIFGFGEL